MMHSGCTLMDQITDENPPWVPGAVKDIYRKQGFGGVIRTRLLTDLRMKSVWSELRQSWHDNRRTASALNDFDQGHLLSSYDDFDQLHQLLLSSYDDFDQAHLLLLST